MEENQQSPKPAPAAPPSRRKGMSGFMIASIIVGILIIFSLIYFIPFVAMGAEKEAVIKIPAGATVKTVEDSVAKYLGADYSEKVAKAAKLTKADFSRRHGAYPIEEGMSPAKACHRLMKGAQHPLMLTINGFRSADLLAQRVARRLDFTADSLLNAMSDPATLSEYGLQPGQALALFLDDSYEVYWSASPADIIKKVGDNYKRVWNEERTAKAEKLGLTPVQVMTICSIVDEETNKADEKGKVGRLYINRLNVGMPLQADPTIRFALGDFTIKRVKGEHLNVDSPFNTYRNRGLPPAPIRTTSFATIDSVLDSEPSEYLYMCAKEDFSGYHNFAESYAEHLDNARRYQKELDRLGIE